jgi:hypothetical protein
LFQSIAFLILLLFLLFPFFFMSIHHFISSLTTVHFCLL